MPILNPDMTFYSLLAVTKRLNGIGKAEEISRTLFSNSSAALRHDFSPDLDVFCNKTGNAFGNPIEVAIKTSTLPYFLRFRPQTTHDKALGLMAGSTVEPLKFVLGLPPGPSGAFLPLSYCNECLKEDIINYGYAYWHRKHQLPTVMVCPTHSTPLNYAKLRINGRGRSGLFLPNDDEIQKYQSKQLIGSAKPILERLSTLSSMVLDQELSAPYSANSLKATYLHGLKQQGLLSVSGRVRAKDFVNRITKHYEAISNLPTFDRIVGSRFADGLLRLVRKPRVNFHTASHLIMVDFLFGDWKLFNSVYLWEQQMDLPLENGTKLQATCPSHKNLSKDLEDHLLELANRFNNKKGSLTSLAKQLNININTAMRWLGKLGLIEIPRKPKTISAKIRANVINLLKQGCPLKAVSYQTGLSSSSIDRICNEEPNLQKIWKEAHKKYKRQKEREKFLNFLTLYPSTTQSELRQSNDSGYRWLYNNDLLWLSQHLPTKRTIKRAQSLPVKPRVNWVKRDNQCLAALKVINMENLESWERIKPKAFLRRLPKLSFSPRLDKLPKSKLWVQGEIQRLNKL